MTRVYRLFTSSMTATADNKASLRISRDGVVTAVCLSGHGVQGADITGVQSYEVSKQSASSFTLNDTPNSVLCHATIGAHGVASETTADNVLIAGLQWPVQNGDTLYLHELVRGTAPTGGSISVDIFVNE